MVINKININKSFGKLRYLIIKIIIKLKLNRILFGLYHLTINILFMSRYIRRFLFKYIYAENIVRKYKFSGKNFISVNEYLNTKNHEVKKRILILRPDHIGDLIYSLPAIYLLKKNFKDYSFEILIGDWNKEIIENLGIFDIVYTANIISENPLYGRLPSVNEILEIVSIIGSVDVVVNLRIDVDISYLINYLKYSKYFYIINQTNSLPDLYNEYTTVNRESKIIGIKLSSLNENISLVTYSFAILIINNFNEKLIKNEISNNNNFDINDDRMKIANLLSNKFYSPNKFGDYIVICPEAGLKIKEWNELKINRFIDKISESYHQINILLIGIKFKYTKKHKNLVNLIGKTSKFEAISLINNSLQFIGFDSGMSHVAAALNKDLVVIFNGSTSFKIWEPQSYSSKIFSISPEISCSPCYLRKISKCPNNFICSEKIDIDTVVRNSMQLYNFKIL